MTQTTTTGTPISYPLADAGVNVAVTTDNAILVGVWSTPMAVSAESKFTATPGAAGSILVQFSPDSGVTWVNGPRFTTVFTGEIPNTATQIRATATVATATLAVSVPAARYLVDQAGTSGNGASFGAGLLSGLGNSLETPRNDVMLLLGNSLEDRGFTTPDVTRANNFAHLANCLAGAPFYPINGGVSGQTTIQIQARLADLISTYKPALIVCGPNSVNDPSGGITADQSIAAIGATFNMARRSGALLIVMTVHDGTAGSSLDVAAASAYRKWYKQVNTFIRDYAAGKPSANPYGYSCYLFDFARVVDEPTSGGMKSGFDQNGDGRHLSFNGGYRVGRNFFDTIFTKLPLHSLRMPERFNPANLFGPFGAVVGNNATGVAGFLLGTGATGTGPNGWGYRRDSGDAVSTIDGTAGVTANSDVYIGGNKATVTVTAGKDGGGGGFAIPQNSAVNRYSNPWAATTAYTWGNKVRISSSLCAQVFTPGTSAAASAAPNFAGLVPGDVLVDGTVTWMVTDRPKPGDKMRVLVNFDSTLASGTGGVYLWAAVTDTAGTATINTYCLATTGSDFVTFGPYPDFSPFTGLTTLRHEFTIPTTSAEIGELSARLFFVGGNTSVSTINCYGASLEII